MYLRYGDPSWDSPESADPAAPAAADQRAEQRRHAARRRRSPAGERLPVVDLNGVEVHAITEKQAIGHIMSELEGGRGGVVITPNLDHLRRCRTDVHFEALVAEADLVVADGMPLVWASRVQGTPLPERVAGSNMISTLSAAAAVNGRSVFLLGGAPGTAEGAAEVLRQRYPGLRVAGTYCPPPGFEQNKRTMSEMSEALTRSGADIVFVALGSPKQEMLIARIRNVLPQAWWLGVGNSFSFLCGHVRRAPLWMQKYGMEWLHRLSQEPRRLFKRYLLVGLPFGVNLLARSAKRGAAARETRWTPRDGYRRVRSDPLPVAPVDGGAGGTNGDGNGTPHDVSGGANGDRHALGIDVDGLTGLARVAAEPRLSPEDSGLAMAPPSESAPPNRLSKLRALVLLGGSVRPSPLSAAGRSVLDLPLDDGGSLLNHWLREAVEVARAAGLDRLPVRVLVNHASLEPFSAQERYFGSFRVERDLSEYRGTGGVLRDVCADYADDDLILVANAAQVLLDPLAALATTLERKGGDVCLVSHDDGTPSGVMLLTVKTLRLIPAAGFVDMKEQVLPLVSSRFDVRVMRRRRPTGLPVRTLEDYIQALRFHHRRRAGKPVTTDPLAEDFAPAFSLVEPGASVDASARVHDSVVLAGGTVEPGAVLVRCVVCPEATVRRDRTEVDRFVTAVPRDRDDRRARRGMVEAAAR